MSETFPSDEQGPKFAMGFEDNFTVFGDGTTQAEQTVISNGMNPEEVREAAAEANGVDTDNVTIRTINGQPYDPSRRRGRTSVSFIASRWNASWDPKENAQNN